MARQNPFSYPLIQSTSANQNYPTAESRYFTAFSAVAFCIVFGNNIDYGYTGTDFSRPGVQRLLSDAQTGRINIIVVKDLSRFGRNYIEVGRYTDE